MSHLLRHACTEFYLFIHQCPSFLVNRLIRLFNAWRKYFHRSQAQVFQAGQRRSLIGNSLQFRHFYVSTSYNWIWFVEQPHGNLALQMSTKLQVILGDASIYIASYLEPKGRLGDSAVPYSTFKLLI